MNEKKNILKLALSKLADIKTYWKTPPAGKYVPYKEYKDITGNDKKIVIKKIIKRAQKMKLNETEEDIIGFINDTNLMAKECIFKIINDEINYEGSM